MLASLIMVAALWPPQVIQFCKPDDNTYILGMASSPSGDFLYCENIEVASKNNLNISYTRDGKKFAEKKVHLVDNPATPAVEQTDSRSGEVRLASISQQVFRLQYQASRMEKMQHVDIPATDVDVIDAGFDYFIKQHWDDLQEGKVFPVNFASIAHQKVLPLRVRKFEPEKCREKNDKEIQPYCYLVEIDNAILRLLLGNIKLSYDQQHNLRHFNGVVNIEDDKGATQSAHISYYYASDQTAESLPK